MHDLDIHVESIAARLLLAVQTRQRPAQHKGRRGSLLL